MIIAEGIDVKHVTDTLGVSFRTHIVGRRRIPNAMHPLGGDFEDSVKWVTACVRTHDPSIELFRVEAGAKDEALDKAVRKIVADSGIEPRRLTPEDRLRQQVENQASEIEELKSLISQIAKAQAPAADEVTATKDTKAKASDKK